MVNGVNLQNGTTYIFQPSDATQLVAFANAGPATLPSGSTPNFGIGRIFSAQNLGPSAVTISCSGCLIFASGTSGSSTLVLTVGQGVDLWSQGLNYYAELGGGTGAGNNSGFAGQSMYYATSGTIGSPQPALTWSGTSATFSGNETVLGQLSVGSAPLGCTSGVFLGVTICGVPALATGVSSNTDGAGTLTASSNTASRNFTGTYTAYPICWAVDHTTHVFVATLTVTTTSLTATTTGASDIVDYGCTIRD